MNILMIAPEPFFEPRGTPISVYQRLLALSRLGHCVDLATYHVGAEVEIRGVNIYRTPRLPFINEVKVGPSLAKLVLDIFLFVLAVKLIVRNRYDVIHSHEEASFFAMILAWVSRTIHVYDMHSSLPKQLKNFGYGYLWPAVKLFEVLEKAVLTSAHAVITIDDSLADHVRAVSSSTNVYTIENLPLDLESSGDDPETDSLRYELAVSNAIPIVYTGTFERYQGLKVLLSAFGAVKNEVENLALILVGGKQEQIDELKRAAHGFDLDGHVYFTGTVSPEIAATYMELAHVLVSPRIDGTAVPLKIYSYLQSGKPILATRISAHTQVLSDRSALLVEPTGEALAEGLLRLLGDKELRDRLALEARELARDRYDPSNYIVRVDQLYDRLALPVNISKQTASTTEN